MEDILAFMATFHKYFLSIKLDIHTRESERESSKYRLDLLKNENHIKTLPRKKQAKVQ